MAEGTSAEQQYPNLNPYATSNGNSKFHHLDLPSSLSTSSISNIQSPASQPTMNSLTNGPVAEKAKAEAANAKSELSNLASSRSTPNNTTATGQKLTHYHSFFYELLSWSNPRATGIAYAALVLLIFTTRYVPLVRWFLKGAYILLGITAAAEMTGKLAFGEGFATKMRPKRYYTIPHETLESIMQDLVELGNFFVIEFQRIVFAENVEITVGAFLTALITYFLVKITPAWGLALLFTSFAFFTPLIYIQNQELIDHHISNAQDLLNQQATQVRDLASQHTSKAMEASQSALKDYSAKASGMIGGAKKAAVDKGVLTKDTVDKLPGGGTAASPNLTVKQEDFPSAPTHPLDENTHTDPAAEKQPLLS